MPSASTDALVATIRAAHAPEGRRGERLVERLVTRLDRRSVVPVALLLTLAIGVGDLATGVELPFTLLYLLPIGLGTWCRDRVFGAALAGLATVGVLASVLEDYAWIAVVWNTAGAMILLLATVVVVDRLHAYVAREQSERRLAVDQLRHAERLNVIGTLAAGVAHELGTPLNVIAGCAEMLAEDSTDEAVGNRTRMIIEQTAKISAIIRHLLDFGRRGGVERELVDLDRLVVATTDMLRALARKRGASLEVALGAHLVVLGSARELEQVLSNLIVNGLQAIGAGGVVRVHTSIERRTDASGEVRALAAIEIADDGRGIPAEDVSRIFDPFFTTKGVGEGTGLGLSVSYGIVRDHGGGIEVHSAPRRGSRFTVLLPLAA